MFISYAHEDGGELRDRLAAFFDARGVEPLYDARSIRPLAELDKSIKWLIDRSSVVVALGTEAYMRDEHGWCKAEVAYTRAKRKKQYWAVLVSRSDQTYKPSKWFLGEVSATDHEQVVCIQSPDGDFSPLKRKIRELRQGTGVEPRWVVALLLAILLAFPFAVSVVFQSVAGQSGAKIRVVQSWVEELNARVENERKGRPQELKVGQRVHRITGCRRREAGPKVLCDGEVVIGYFSRDKDEIVACDVFAHGRLQQRHFFRDCAEFAVDTLAFESSPAGGVLRKTRSISPPGRDSVLIEDTFDSVGNLISKRVQASPTTAWTEYVDVGHSLYPGLFMAFYR